MTAACRCSPPPGSPGSWSAAGRTGCTAPPSLLPAPGTTLRADLDRWFQQHGLRPTIAGEFDDSALLKSFAAAGDGVFAMHDAAQAELEGRLGFERMAGLSGLRQRVFAVVRREQRDRPSIRAILAKAAEAFEEPLQQAIA